MVIWNQEDIVLLLREVTKAKKKSKSLDDRHLEIQWRCFWIVKHYQWEIANCPPSFLSSGPQFSMVLPAPQFMTLGYGYYKLLNCLGFRSPSCNVRRIRFELLDSCDTNIASCPPAFCSLLLVTETLTFSGLTAAGVMSTFLSLLQSSLFLFVSILTNKIQTEGL